MEISARVETPLPRAQKSCLHCRGRKIACDRSFPGCKTCQRRQKVCPGYFENLSWPREGDKRRSATANVKSKTLSGAIVFLNTSSWDASLHHEYQQSGSHANHMGVWLTPSPSRSISSRQFGTGISPQQYSAAIRMISARGDLRKDVCTLLYRMSLTDDTAPSLAVRHSMNAISYLHLDKSPEALHHYVHAVSALKTAIDQVSESKARSQTIAASMLLSLFESVNKNGTIESWSTYFDGCLMIVRSGHEKHQTYEGDDVTLLDWVLYHNVMYKFSITHWLQRTVQQEIIAGREIVISKAIFSPHRLIIQSTLGCSLELLDLLGQAFDFVRQDPSDSLGTPMSLSSSRSSRSPRSPSAEDECTIARLERRFKNVDQRLCSGIDDEELHSIGSRKRYTLIARLFQLCGLIYLDRVARAAPMTSPKSRAAADEAFSILKDLKGCQLNGCERPFVLFILSIQAQHDVNRILILEILEQATVERTLSNLESTEKMIRAMWAQQDLNGDEDVDALFAVNAVVSANKTLPQFT